MASLRELLTTYSMFFVGIFILSTTERAVSGSICVSRQHVNGCSVPMNTTSFPYKIVFKSACNRHDVCYRCGSYYGWPRKDCDKGFLNDMYHICKNDYKRKRRSMDLSKNRRDIDFYEKQTSTDRYGKLFSIRDASLTKRFIQSCKVSAYLYYLAVRSFGGLHYNDEVQGWCKNICSEFHGVPNLRKYHKP